MASIKKKRVVTWPEAAVVEIIAMADETGRPCLGDAIATAAWLGMRRLEWLTLSVSAFERPFPLVDTAEFGPLQASDWTMLAPLRHRIEKAKIRRLVSRSKYPNFFLNDVDGLPWTVRRLNDAFELSRRLLATRYESFPTEYTVNYYVNDSRRVPLAWLTMRGFRLRCITALSNAGFQRETIQVLTGHSMANIESVFWASKK
jgi:hypothetical protein